MVILQWPSSGIQTEIDILSLVNIETSHSSSQSEILRHRPGHAPGSLFILVTLSVLLLHKIRRLIYVYFIAHFHYIGLINRCFQLLHFVCVLRVCILLRAFVVGNAESSYINNKNFLDFRCRADIQVFFNDNGKLLPIRTVTCKCLWCNVLFYRNHIIGTAFLIEVWKSCRNCRWLLGFRMTMWYAIRDETNMSKWTEE